ncbi:MAG: hypothetical protein F6K35_46475, partial [Okeania sp. SIO2H7]|nr:hypothetical protein [Okeania sp. SIO2H7]
CRDENGGSSPTAASMRWPHALAVWGDRLVVTDAGNNRICVWDEIPRSHNAPCSLVLGQGGFDTVELNRGNYFPSADSLSMPYGVAAVDKWLIAADTANSRLLGWRQSVGMGERAVALSGQPHFQSKSENRNYGSASRNSLCWPYGVFVCGNLVAIADSGNNRVLLWFLSMYN